MIDDPYKYFRIEARELVDELGKGVLMLEKGEAVAEQVAKLLRIAHTLKGAARVVKAREIADHAHAIEDVLAPFRDGDAQPQKAAVDRLLALTDDIEARRGALGGGEPAARSHDPSRSDAKPVEIKPALALEQSARTLRADLEEMDELIDGVVEAQTQLATLRKGVSSMEGLHGRVQLLLQHLRVRAQRSAAPQDQQLTAMLEDLQNAIAEIEGGFERGGEQVDRELRQVRSTAERLRLLPVETVMSQLERTARDAAQSLGKKVRFKGVGGELRLDAHVLHLAQQALVQLVRNAVAHGIESEHERRAAGKPAEGQVVVEVVRRGHRVSFTCRDDGRGVDFDAVRKAAQSKGLIAASVTSLSPAELASLLLGGGISTSRTITEVAGRGVGMGIVNEAVARLGGELRLNAQAGAGRGTAFELIVPVSLTSLDALVVEAGAQAAVIPLDAVRRTLRLAASDVTSTSEGQSIVYDGKVIPFVPLARSLRVKPKPLDAGRAREESKVLSAVVVESRGVAAALGVDRLLGTENVLVRPLSAWTPLDAVVAGAALDAGGMPQLVLDADALVAAASSAIAVVAPDEQRAHKILVVDDSLTTRMLEQSILQAAGYEVDLATSGEEGLAMLRAGAYALLLVDVEMPGIDGFEVIARLRADPELRGLPAILVTSRNAPEDMARGREVGASGHIIKSEFDQADFLDRIAVLVRGSSA